MTLAASDNRTEIKINALRNDALGCQLCASTLPDVPVLRIAVAGAHEGDLPCG
jgi:hypothetical protein